MLVWELKLVERRLSIELTIRHLSPVPGYKQVQMVRRPGPRFKLLSVYSDVRSLFGCGSFDSS